MEYRSLESMNDSEQYRLKRRALGGNIARLRTERHITQKRLALMTGMNKGYLCDVENGKANISIDKLFQIAEALDIHPQSLLEGTD